MKSIIPFLLLLCACSERPENAQDINSKEFDYEAWVKDSIKPLAPELIEFTYSLDETDNWPDDISDLTFVRNSDTLTVSFQKVQWVGCEVFGNLRISKDTVKLLFSNECPPNMEAFVDEVAQLSFVYRIHWPGPYKHLKWVPTEESLKIEP